MTSRDSVKDNDGELEEEDGDSLPSYEYLAERNPNSRFGRWQQWIEKRAAERYDGIDEAERQRRRDRGWGNDILDDPNEQPSISYEDVPTPIPDPSRLSISTNHLEAVTIPPEPPVYTEYLQSHFPPGACSGATIEPAHVSLYNFGSRFLPHSKAPIHSLLPIMQDRFLLIGTQDGMSMIDTSPNSMDENSNLVEGLNGAIHRDLWRGESIHQLTLLEYNETSNGVPQGVVVALVGVDQGEGSEKEKDFRSVRMYNLSSLASLALWASSQKTNQPIDLQPLPRGNPPNTLKKHRARASITRSIRSMVSEPSSPPTESGSTCLEACSPPRPPCKVASLDSTLGQSQWDLIDDLPLRWASDYVSLANESSRLGSMSVVCYDIWREGQTKLAIATKNYIFLYTTPKGERAFKFIKEFYTPLVPRCIKFSHQSADKTNPNNVQQLGHRREISAPLSLDITDHLCLFVHYGKKAGLIRISDSIVSEVELCEEYPDFLQESSSSNGTRSGSIRKSLSFSESINSVSRDKSKWLEPSFVQVSANNTISGGSLCLLTKGLSTHILPSPLPNPVNSRRPYKIVSWTNPPTSIIPRLLTNTSNDIPVLQVISLGNEGVEIQELSLSFLSKSKGKGKGISRTNDDILVKAYQDIGPSGFLCIGGAWHRENHFAPATARSPSLSSTWTVPVVREEGIYAWAMKGYHDWRIIWLGGNCEQCANTDAPR